jgi:4-hydroxy-tetrahydrodipicolinate reductase
MENIKNSVAVKSLKIALIGYGKMGKAIEEIALKKGHSIVLKIDADNQEEFTADNLQKCDVAIEFTSPHAAVQNIKTCMDAGIPVVSGSTGWMHEWKNVASYCEERSATLIYASNYSVGVNIFFEVNKKLASMMSSHPAYSVMVEEIHHTAKKDAPSGTAITLAEQVMASYPNLKNWVNDVTKNESELSIISKRIDPAPGTHHVKYSSDIDDIEIIHTAHNRKGFASGAVLAAEYIAGKKGIYTMQDVLGF